MQKFIVENESLKETLKSLSQYDIEPTKIDQKEFRTTLFFPVLSQDKYDLIENLIESIFTK